MKSVTRQHGGLPDLSLPLFRPTPFQEDSKGKSHWRACVLFGLMSFPMTNVGALAGSKLCISDPARLQEVSVSIEFISRGSKMVLALSRILRASCRLALWRIRRASCRLTLRRIRHAFYRLTLGRVRHAFRRRLIV